MKYENIERLLKHRILVDIDNERPYDSFIVGLTKSNEVVNFEGNTITVKEGDYIYVITENYEEGKPDHILGEGYVILSPYEDLSYKLCCKLEGEIKYLTDICNDK